MHLTVEIDMQPNLSIYREAALESVRISGYEPKIILPVKKEDEHEVKKDEGFERHVVIMEAVLSPGCSRLIHPIILNMNLCDDRHEIQWRTGIPGALYGELPSGKFTKRLVSYWWMKTNHETERLRCASELTKEAFAWRTHDFFLCLQPFIRGNGRTARLIHHNVRNIVGLSSHITHYEKAREYHAHVGEYRRTTFIPLMREHGYIPE